MRPYEYMFYEYSICRLEHVDYYRIYICKHKKRTSKYMQYSRAFLNNSFFIEEKLRKLLKIQNE